jgi:predicted NAD/FAD-binding protein
MDVAVIGGGVSGLYTAQQITSKHQVTIFEQEAQLGGHAHTVSVNLNQDIIDVDMGFIVCNDRNYPLFNQWLEELNVQRIKSDMSFGVNDLKNDIIWSSNAPFGQTKNWFRWRHYQMFLDIISFFRKAEAYVAKNPDAQLKTMVNDLGRGAFWWQHFLYPMAASIWSTSFQAMDDFPAAMLVTFFQNHGLMSLINHPQWYTIQGGSRSYVQAACQQMSFKKMSGASRVRRQGQHVLVMDDLGQEHRFDQVFFAVHPSIIRHITVDLSPEEDAI